MSFWITIKQKGFSKKTLPLEVILGEKLKYGAFSGDCLEKDVLGEGEFIAYNPEHIGRGFSVTWTPDEKKKIEFRLLIPSTPEELRDVFDAAERVASYWNASIVADDTKMKLPAFREYYNEMVKNNENMLKRFSDEVIKGTYETLTLYSALFPLHLSKEEAEVFANDPEAFYRWLHEKQSVDAVYSSPNFFMKEDGNICAIFRFIKGKTHIFPVKPTVPFGVADPRTGKALECSDYGIVFFEKDNDEKPEASMSYSEFLTRAENFGKQKFTAELFLLPALSGEDYAKLIEE